MVELVNSCFNVFAQYEWLYEKEWNKTKLRVTYLDKNKRDAQGRFTCRKSDYRFADNVFCYTSREFDIDLKTFSNINIESASTDYEADVVTRWLNTHVTPVTEKGVIPYGTTEVPTYFKSSSDFSEQSLK